MKLGDYVVATARLILAARKKRPSTPLEVFDCVSVLPLVEQKSLIRDLQNALRLTVKYEASRDIADILLERVGIVEDAIKRDLARAKAKEL